ncbi:MAG: helix-turn-helix domain-containing protein [Candidatus Microsaccharimonas sp.]
MDFSLLGLNTRDKRVYEALSLSKRASIRRLSELTGINRGSVYESLKDLMAIGLVNYVLVGKTKKYIAEDPEKLHEIINEKRRQLDEAHSDVDQYISRSQQFESKSDITQFASFYEGDEGMANVLRDVLTTCRLKNLKEYRVVSSSKVSEYLYNNFRHYTQERIKQGLSVKVLRMNAPASNEIAELTSIKTLSMPHRQSCYIIIYGSKVATISIDRLNHTSAIIIENDSVVETQSAIFDHAWAAC